MSTHHGAHSSGPEGAAAAASSEPEVVDAEVVEEEVLDAEVVDGDGVHDAAANGEPETEAEAAAVEDDPLADALRERAEYLELAQRTRADFENYKRRAAMQAKEAEQRGRAAIARNLLPAIDNLQRALAAAADEQSGGAADDELTKGFVLVHDELRTALERSGVNAFDPAGSKFDPTLHEAVSTAPAEGVEPGTVLETLELGYKVDEQVIRPARVVVSG
ncbi:MAG: nucleotide exchange factor GrpE [Thermoleophilales bacterium]|nr:nucleotide exchange factor GrpE [Thermoleophilales bacterium]